MSVCHRWLRAALLSVCLITTLSAAAVAQTVTLAWDPSAGATGYVVKWGTAPGSYPNSADAGGSTSFTLTNLIAGQSYVAVVEAYNADGLRSEPSTPLQFVAIAPPSSNQPPRDIDGDGRPDIVWQNARDGYIAAWTMEGERLKSSELMSPGRVADTAWRIVASGDFNGDSKPDLVWQHKTEGWLAVWLMDGLNLIESASMSPERVSDTSWEIATTADLNGDGKSDLVWQERKQGWIAAWLMNGTKLAQSVGLNPERVPDTGWKIVAAADMDADGHEDLVWQHTKDGYLAAWLMNGTSLIDSVLLSPGRVSDTNWAVVGVADANGDGKPDLFWRDAKHGDVAVWLMDGIKLKTSMALQPERVADTNWRIVAVR